VFTGTFTNSKLHESLLLKNTLPSFQRVCVIGLLTLSIWCYYRDGVVGIPTSQSIFASLPQTVHFTFSSLFHLLWTVAVSYTEKKLTILFYR
jgi:hypothetical protein